jgi:hypothetical protein|tara:strand:+ start:618 stop:1766 length:1149 start_codon:yes stop_codon:yes gene_type:complete
MSFKSLVNKLVKEGKSREAATKIAGKVANAKMKGAGSGPTAKQKARMKKGSPSKMKDLSGDGKITKKDVLIGRGVIKKDDSPAKMDHGKKSPAKMSKKRELIKSGYSRKTAKSVAKSQKKGEKTRTKLAKVGSKARAAAEKKEKMQPFIDRYGEAGAKKGMKAEAKAVKKTNKAENKVKSDAAKAKAKRTKKELKQSIKQAKGDLKTFKRTGINLSSPANNKEKRATKKADKVDKLQNRITKAVVEGKENKARRLDKKQSKVQAKSSKAEAKSFKKFAKSVKKSVRKASKSSALNFQAYDQMDTRNAKQTAGSPMGMYGKHSPANAYGKSPMNMSGQSYDAKEAYNKNLSASARLHYLENNRADAKAKKGGSSISKHMGGRR